MLAAVWQCGAKAEAAPVNMMTNLASNPSAETETTGPTSGATSKEITEAVQHLKDGACVVLPTETVYGIGADATNDDAVLNIYEAKGRPRFNPLIIHVDSLNRAQKYGEFDQRALALAAKFWPGPLTIVVPLVAESGLSDLVTAGLGTVAIRVPAHKVAREVLGQVALPIAAPSANISNTVSPTTAAHVRGVFGRSVAMILDGGPTECGLESTIVSVIPDEPVRYLRPGSITRDDISVALGEQVDDALEGKVTAPGQMRRHYAPKTKLRLNAASALPGECLIAFGPPPDGQQVFLNLSPSGDLREAASGLFAALRALDDANKPAAAIMPIPQRGIGEAINDRLARAAAPEEV